MAESRRECPGKGKAEEKRWRLVYWRDVLFFTGLASNRESSIIRA